VRNSDFRSVVLFTDRPVELIARVSYVESPPRNSLGDTIVSAPILIAAIAACREAIACGDEGEPHWRKAVSFEIPARQNLYRPLAEYAFRFEPFQARQHHRRTTPFQAGKEHRAQADVIDRRFERLCFRRRKASSPRTYGVTVVSRSIKAAA
jgi:hypothetical protein